MKINYTAIHQYIFVKSQTNAALFETFYDRYSEVQYIESVKEWINAFGSNYLKKLYPDFFYFGQFLKEFYANLLQQGWDIFNIHEDLVEKVETPTEEVLDNFFLLKEVYMKQEPFIYGCPQIYKKEKEFIIGSDIQSYVLFFGYDLGDDILFAKELK